MSVTDEGGRSSKNKDDYVVKKGSDSLKEKARLFQVTISNPLLALVKFFLSLMIFSKYTNSCYQYHCDISTCMSCLLK